MGFWGFGVLGFWGLRSEVGDLGLEIKSGIWGLGSGVWDLGSEI